MRVSVFTPSHHPRYLDDCYRSLTAQSYPDWEWVVLLNGKAPDWAPPQPDERVKLVRASRGLKGVGAVKRAACEAATGDVLLELDHDDRLTPNCLVEVVDAFTRDRAAVLAYSDWTQINDDGTPNHDRFDETAGWVYSPEDIGGLTYLRCHAMA